MLLDLQLDQYAGLLKLKTEEGKRFIWDPIRRKWLVLQPEEMVRQLLICYFLETKQVNKNRIAIERGLRVLELYKRCDILIYDAEMAPWLLIECKAPQIALNQETFNQIARYNMPLQVPNLLVCNGPDAYVCQINFEDQLFTFLAEVPDYPK